MAQPLTLVLSHCIHLSILPESKHLLPRHLSLSGGPLQELQGIGSTQRGDTEMFPCLSHAPSSVLIPADLQRPSRPSASQSWRRLQNLVIFTVVFSCFRSDLKTNMVLAQQLACFPKVKGCSHRRGASFPPDSSASPLLLSEITGASSDQGLRI